MTFGNSSSRISSIADVRSASAYEFSYNSDAIPHLTTIVNNIGTSENYNFAYAENYGLTSPYGGQSYGSVALLESSTVPISGVPLTTYFTYDTSSATTSCGSSGTGTSGPGELTQVTTPYCGHQRWTYTPYTLSGSRTYREVQYRYLSMASGAAETTIQLKRANDTAYTVHSSAELDDTPANAEKYWTFQTSTTQFNLGLQLSYEELTLSTGTALSLLDFTWAQTPTSLNPYIGTTVTKLDPGQTYEADKQTIQTLSQTGNLKTMQVYNFGAGAVGSLARTYTNTYLNSSNYTSLYILNRVLTSTVTDGTNTATLVSNAYDGSAPANITGYLTQHDSNYSNSFLYRGNITSSTTPATITNNGYDITGNVIGTTVNGVSSTLTDNSMTNYAAPSEITTNSLSSSLTWTSFLGLSSATGPNGDTASISYDAAARPYIVTSPYGAVITYAYNDTASPPNKIATTCPSAGSCTGSWVKTVMDGFGRTIQTVTGYGTTTVSTVDAQYAPCGCSPLGKLSQQSEPYAPGGSDAWTVYHYDASGRTLSSVLPDGSTTSYVYQGNTVKVTDPAGKWKTFTMDAFGNLTGVLESDPSLGNVTTNYTYDVLNHLTAVSMPRGATTQTRTFNYTSSNVVGGFLLSATNPENGTVTYTYNTGTNTLASKTDAKGQQLTYQYDGYNRLTSVSGYTTPPCPNCVPPIAGVGGVLRTYTYDTALNGLGRLAGVTYATLDTVQINESYAYVAAGTAGGGLPASKSIGVSEPYEYQNAMGDYEHVNVGGGLTATYTYNGLGKVTAVTYPSTVATGGTVTAGPTYNYSYDSMYRLSGMTQTTTPTTTIVSNVSYNAANQLLTMNYPGYKETRSYNTLGQLTNLNVENNLYQPTENLTYNYPTGTNNGKVSSMYNAVSGETITYAYDSLNRIATAGGSGWGQQYGFDPFGNLTSKTVTSGSGPSLSVSINPANNQLEGVSGYTYDANGNMSLGTGTLAYDVENRISVAASGASTVSYAYDSQNRRVWSWPGTKDSLGNVTGYTLNMYSPTGQKLGAYTFAPAVNGSYEPYMAVMLVSSDQYFGSRRLAVLDQLESVGTYFPWGENRGSTNPQNTWSFATYWEDSVTGLDYANNRYYSNAYGRFMTPDPYQASGGPSDPQSWNRYAYTRGDPVNRYDPWGTQDCPPGQICTYSGPYPNPTNGQGDLGDQNYGASPGINNGGGIQSPWNDPVGQKTVIPPVNKSYPSVAQAEPCEYSGTQLITNVESNFARFGNFTTTVAGVTESVAFNPPPGALTVGESIPITIQVGGAYTLNTSVTVSAVTSNSFTFSTVPGHILYPASITFSDVNLGNGELSFNINVSGKVPGFWAGVAWVLGGSSFEDAQWNNFLNNVADYCNLGSLPKP